MEAASGLPEIVDCADVRALRSTFVAPPPGTEHDVAALRALLAQVRVGRLAGDHRAAAEAGGTLIAAARGLGYPPLVAEASYEQAMALAQSRYDDALFELTAARDLWRAALGHAHPHVAIAWNNLGQALAAMGRHEEALASYREALRIRERANGPTHVHVADVLVGMAHSLRALGQLHAAAAAAARALGIRQQQLGPTHATTTAAARLLAEIEQARAAP